MYELERVTDDIHRITLGEPAGLPELLGQPTHIYLLGGDRPALINAGHPCQFEALGHALRELGLGFGDIERVLYTSWDIAVLGAAANMPGVDHFVLSPDMVEPTNYEAEIARRRARIRELAAEIVALGVGYVADDLEGVERMIATYYPPMPSRLQFIPIRNGHTVCAGDFEFEAMAAPGPGPGHAVYYDAERRAIFGGDFTTIGIPRRIDEVQSYLVSLERLQRLDIDALYLTHEPPVTSRGGWTVRRALRFLNNFMSTAPAAMHGAPTVVEFIESDLGYHIDDLAEMVLQVERYKVPMDELVRARMIDAEGEGLERKYGTDVEDDRAALRR
jgi:glyoxylase-like metal-dependent hydrolase (beta-lactamase superfamily II)